ncbi:hypothetical protein EXIGLDRAFT_733372 [Exidia glandulosa HHB12029]|uniref:Uncharacterized protein n=1 Tax=Exidia glandulosa HHB12029 TaxID=1314781 RepID=A0A165BBN7_EXIGL|nr:hypothetical protein EXIGLDRAFT_733372 [Exidia glandulosa HHB12029]
MDSCLEALLGLSASQRRALRGPIGTRGTSASVQISLLALHSADAAFPSERAARRMPYLGMPSAPWTMSHNQLWTPVFHFPR